MARAPFVHYRTGLPRASRTRCRWLLKVMQSTRSIMCARAAGAVIEAPDGGELDFPIDTETPVSWVGWVNRATRDRLAPHLAQVLERIG